MRSNGICVALVCNRAYLHKALLTIWQLRIFGRFSGDVVLVIGDDLRDAIGALRRSLLRITPLYFPDIERDLEDKVINRAPGTLDSQSKKTFQFQKFFCFSPVFKKWNRVLYLDAKMRIYAPLDPLFRVDCSGSLVAHSDAYPDFQWTLSDQFNFVDFPELRSKLSEVADLSSDYFQTTMMYYDTAIIEDGTVTELIELSRTFPNSRTNDQGIINIWAQNRGIWKKLPTKRHGTRFLYDFHERPGCGPEDYLMVKYPKIPKKSIPWLLAATAFGFLKRIEMRRVDSQSRRP